VATALEHRVHYTYAEYIELEASSNVKHEYSGGRIYAMAGGTPEHAALQAAVAGLLFSELRNGPCRAHSSDLRVRVLATGLATYPDISVVCGRTERDPEDANAVINPTLLVEVTSRSSEEYDRGEKREHFQQIPSLEQYVVISHRERRVDLWTRDGDAWRHESYGNEDCVALSSIHAKLSVSELYDAAAEPLAT
jgi:Uma2 family endonuclease